MIKVDLSIKDRLVLKNVLNMEGTIDEAATALDIYNKTKITEDEVRALSAKFGSNMIDPDKTGLPDLTVDFTEGEAGRIRAIFRQLSDRRMMKMELFETYKKFA